MQVDGLDHINIITRDLAGTVAFYQSVLGLSETDVPVMPKGYIVRWLTDTAGRPIFHVQQFDPERHGPDGAGDKTGPIDHVALQCQDFDGMVSRCEQLGLRYRTNVMAERSFKQLFLTDPNGIVLELNFRG